MPLARDGHRITGLDNAPAMLKVFREKIEEAADPELAGRIRLVEADMRDFDLGQTYGLVFIGWNSLMHLQTIADQLAFLGAAKRHLAPGGILAIDIFNPDFGYLLEGSIQSREHVGVYPSTGRGVWRTEEVEIEAGDQLVHLRIGYLEEGAPPEEERVIQTTLRFFFRFEMEHLIARAGLELKRLVGEYDGSPYKSGAERLLCLGRARGLSLSWLSGGY